MEQVQFEDLLKRSAEIFPKIEIVQKGCAIRARYSPDNDAYEKLTQHMLGLAVQKVGLDGFRALYARVLNELEMCDTFIDANLVTKPKDQTQQNIRELHMTVFRSYKLKVVHDIAVAIIDYLEHHDDDIQVPEL